MHNEFGASPKALALFANKPDRYESILRRKIDEMGRTRSQRAFQDPGSYESLHNVTIVEPSLASRGVSETRVASRRIFELLWDRYLRYKAGDMAYFYYLFWDSPPAATAAGWVFESRMHQVLSRKQTIRLFPIHDYCADARLVYDNYIVSERQATSLQSTGSGEHDLVERAQLQENQYYRHGSTSFPSIDSLLLVRPRGRQPILLMFQIAWNESEHDVDANGLREINSSGVPLGVRGRCVVVTPEGVRPKTTVPMECFREEERRKIRYFRYFITPSVWGNCSKIR